MRFRFRLWWREQLERLVMAIAWWLPHEIVNWCFIRVVAHATQGKYSATEVPSLTAIDALGRWTRGKGVPGSPQKTETSPAGAVPAGP